MHSVAVESEPGCLRSSVGKSIQCSNEGFDLGCLRSISTLDKVDCSMVNWRFTPLPGILSCISSDYCVLEVTLHGVKDHSVNKPKTLQLD